MTGKEKCNCLKQIRKTIADLNGIEYHPRECDEEVCNCGTCSLCDQEAEQLLAALRKKRHQVLLYVLMLRVSKDLAYWLWNRLNMMEKSLWLEFHYKVT